MEKFAKKVKTEERKQPIQNPQPQIHNLVQNPSRIMTARFAPLALPIFLHDLPHNYAQRITVYDGEGNFTTQQHVDIFNDFIDLEEVDYDDAKMRLFAEILSRYVKKWFKYLPKISIPNFE